MTTRYTYLFEKNNKIKKSHKPEFFRLQREDDRRKFNEIIESADVFLFDELNDQLKELIKSRNP